MKPPTQCVFWSKPELLIDSHVQRFDLLERFVEESHLSRMLVKCRECGQLYFYEFYEFIDWESGEDPQYLTYIPVETAAEIERLKKTTPFSLLEFSPRLQRDYPKGAKGPSVCWVK